MLWSLVKIRLKSVFSSVGKGDKKPKKGMTIFIYAALLYALVAMTFMIGSMFKNIASALANTEYSWLYFSLMFFFLITIGFVTTVFAAQSQIFEAKDNELLLSMPIPVKYIITSRIISLLVIDLVEDIIFGVILLVVFIMERPLSPIQIIIYFIELMGIIVMTSTLSTFFGWIFAMISSKFKNKSTFTTIISVAIMVGYFAFINKIQGALALVIYQGESIALSVKKYMYPFYCGGVGIVNKDIIAILIFMLIAIIPFTLSIYLISITYLKVVGANKGVKRKAYSRKTIKTNNMKKALLNKECGRFFSSAPYMLNAGFGLIVMFGLSIYLMVRGNRFQEILVLAPYIQEHIEILIVFAILVLNLFNMVSAPSISLEGDALWITRSLPIESKAILLSKVKAHIMICTPFSILISIVCIWVFDIRDIMIVFIILIPILSILFVAIVGVIANVYLPKLEWVDDTVAVKQSMSVLLTMVVSIVLIASIGILYYFISDMNISDEWMALGIGMILGILCLVCYNMLVKQGVNKFENL